MTEALTDTGTVPDVPGGPYDLEFFLDPGCPFAWQTSVWIRRVAMLRGLTIGWRFISLYVIHELDENAPASALATRRRTLEVLRVLAAVRDGHGNDQVGRLYEAWGNALWYGEPGTPTGQLVQQINVAGLLTAAGLPAQLAQADRDETYDVVVRAETALAFERAGSDLGTPIITFGPPGGNSFFGPVISSTPPDEESLAIYDAVRALARFPDFAELKRTRRPALDLPALKR